MDPGRISPPWDIELAAGEGDRSSSMDPEQESIPSPHFFDDAWEAIIGNYQTQSNTGIENDAEAQMDDNSETQRLLDLMRDDEVEMGYPINSLEPQTFHAGTGAGTTIPPRTISGLKDDLNFDISEFFDIDAAAASSPSASQPSSPHLRDINSSLDDIQSSDATKDNVDQEVSLEEHLKLSQLRQGAKSRKPNPLIGSRGYLTLEPDKAEPATTSFGPAEPKHIANPDVDLLKHAFKAGGEDVCLPAFSDPAHDEEFAAFVAAGRSVNLQFRGLGQESEPNKTDAKTTPSSSRASGQQAPELSPASKKDDFTRAGLIYVAHTLQRKSELSNAPEDNNHSYTKEEVQWARNILPNDVKVWMKRNCGVVGTEKPTGSGLEKSLNKSAPQPELIVSHATAPSTQNPEKRFPKATEDNIKFWAEHDKMMSLSELDAEWDAFENTNSPKKTVAGGFESAVTPSDTALMSKILSPVSAASFITAEDDEMSMIPTISPPNPAAHSPHKSLTDKFNQSTIPKPGTSTSGDYSLSPIVTGISEILLDDQGEYSLENDRQAAEANKVNESDIDESQNLPYQSKALLEDQNCSVKMLGDGNAVSEGLSSPVFNPDNLQILPQEQNTPKVIHDPIEASDDGKATAEHGLANFTEAQRETDESSQNISKSISPKQMILSPSWPALGTEKSKNKEALRSSSAELPASSPGISVSPSSNSASFSGTTLFTCSKCNKVYKKKAYLLKHEAEGTCEPKSPNPPKLPVFAGVPLMKLSMTDQELIDNGLPSMESRNHKGMSYCTACNKEFSNVRRLRSHVLQSCPVLREKGVYNQPQNQQQAQADQDLKFALLKATNTGHHLTDKGESKIENSRASLKSDLGSLKESFDMSSTPVKLSNADNSSASTSIGGPRLGSNVKYTHTPVSMRERDQIKDNVGARKTPVVSSLLGQVKKFDMPSLSDDDLSLMEETENGEKAHKTDSMVEIPALHQSGEPSLLESATPAIARSTPGSRNIQGIKRDQRSTGQSGRVATPLVGSVNSPEINTEPKEKNGSQELPRMHNDYINENEGPVLKYPARLRLFSKEIALSSPRQSDPLEPFEDLSYQPKHVRARKSGEVTSSSDVGRSTTYSAPSNKTILGNTSSVIFSFSSERMCAITTQRLEQLIIGSTDPTIQSLRMWPSFSMQSSASKSTFEFKVTAPESVDLVAILRGLFPQMTTKMQGDQVLFVPGDTSGSPITTNAPVETIMKAKTPKKTDKQACEQPQQPQQRSTRASSGASQSESQMNVKADFEDGSRSSKKRRSSARLAEPQADPDQLLTAGKKRQKTKD